MSELEKEKTKEYSMLWWNLNKYVRFPLGIVLSLGNISYYSELEFNTTIGLLFGIDVICILLLCTTFYHFVKRNKTGYTLLNVLLIVELLTSAFTTTMKSGSFVTAHFIINLCVLGLIWTLPNFIYFRKRRSLFCNNDTDNREDEYRNCEEEKKNNETKDIQINKLEQSQNTDIANKIQLKDILSKENSPITIKAETKSVTENSNKSINETSDQNVSNKTWKTSTIVLGTITIILTIVLIFSIININGLNEEIESLSSTITSQKASYKKLQEKYSECSSEKYKMQQKVNFFDNHAVIIPANTRVYHRYDCTYCDKSSFRIYNSENAIVQGYKPCSHCIE